MKRQGLTLVELLMVIAIIGILFTFTNLRTDPTLERQNRSVQQTRSLVQFAANVAQSKQQTLVLVRQGDLVGLQNAAGVNLWEDTRGSRYSEYFVTLDSTQDLVPQGVIWRFEPSGLVNSPTGSYRLNLRVGTGQTSLRISRLGALEE